MIKTLLVTGSSDMSSGAVRCILDLAIELNKKNDVTPIVLIHRHGNLEKELKKKNIEFYFIHEYQTWYVDGEKNLGICLKNILNLFSIVKTVKLIKKLHIDIVHINSLTTYIAAQAAIISNTKLIWHMREFMDEDLRIWFRYPKYAKKMINKSNLLIAISEPVKEKWKKFFSVPIKVINDGIPIDDYYLSIDNDFSTPINIIIYGRIVPGKGQLFFFKAINKVFKSTNISIHIYWAGRIEDKAYFDKINGYINESMESKYITYLGEVEDVKEMLGKMDITCVCSLKEGFGRVTIESMLAGCVVIGANSGATADIINNGENGYLYDSNSLDSFVKVLLNVINDFDKKYTDIIKNAQDYVINNFTVESNAQEMISTYLEVMKG